MRASRSLSVARRPSGARKTDRSSRTSKPARKATKAHTAPVEPVLFRFCKTGWAVLVERQPSQQGTRFVCPFCPQSHRVSGPVRGFRKVRRAQWIKLRRVDE
ncbi:MAG TPA: hypothetical protein VFB23_07540 [Candidatus Acidoferrales bacterium]|nr:hypothetical protein [Candidatus Acidoferrales bacterium]